MFLIKRTVSILSSLLSLPIPFLHAQEDQSLVSGQQHADDFAVLAKSDGRMRLPFGIAYPRWASALVLDKSSAAGREFAVHLRQSPQAASSDWSIRLIRDDVKKTWDCKLSTTPEYGPHLNGGMEKGWRLQAQAPEDIPPEVFDLEVTAPDGSEYREANAVGVIPRADVSFYAFSVNDIHIENRDAEGPSGESDTDGTIEGFGWYSRVMPVINPRFVVMPGDIFNSQQKPKGTPFNWDHTQKKIQGIREAASGIGVPLMMVSGNHDVSGEGDKGEIRPHDATELLWNREVGYGTFGVKIGSFFVFGTDWMCGKDNALARQIWAASWQDSSITYRLDFEHFVSDGKGKGMSEEDFNESGGYPDLSLIGHSAMFSTVLRERPWPVYISHQCQGSCMAGFVDFRKNGSSWKVWPQPDNQVEDLWYDRPKKEIRPIRTFDEVSNFDLAYSGRERSEWGKPKVSVEFASLNDGSAFGNEATITNRVPLNFYDGRVKFLMAKGNYSVTGGQVLAQYDFQDGARTAVIVRVDIPAALEAPQAVAHVKISAENI